MKCVLLAKNAFVSSTLPRPFGSLQHLSTPWFPSLIWGGAGKNEKGVQEGIERKGWKELHHPPSCYNPSFHCMKSWVKSLGWCDGCMALKSYITVLAYRLHCMSLCNFLQCVFLGDRLITFLLFVSSETRLHMSTWLARARDALLCRVPVDRLAAHGGSWHLSSLWRADLWLVDEVRQTNNTWKQRRTVPRYDNNNNNNNTTIYKAP